MLPAEIRVLNLVVSARDGRARNCHAIIMNHSAKPVIKEGFYGRPTDPFEGRRVA